MDRRTFLACLAAAFAAPVLAKLPAPLPEPTAIESSGLADEYAYVASKFDASAEYGNAVRLTSDAPDLIERAKEMLLLDARTHLPPGTSFYVFDQPAGSMGFDQATEYYALAWYYTPKPLSAERQARVICKAIA